MGVNVKGIKAYIVPTEYPVSQSPIQEEDAVRPAPLLDAKFSSNDITNNVDVTLLSDLCGGGMIGGKMWRVSRTRDFYCCAILCFATSLSKYSI